MVEDDTGERELRLMRWGLIPKWSKPGGKGVAPINARAETLREKPLFRPLLKGHRCIVPASGFYEWRQEGGANRKFLREVAERQSANPEEWARLRRILEESGSIGYCRDTALRTADSALARLGFLPASVYRTALEQAVAYAVSRVH